MGPPDMAFAAVCLAGVLAVLGAGIVIFQRSLYIGALGLLFVSLQSAVLFFFFGAPLLAFLQVMIYAGAVMVLIVVAIMTAPAGAASVADPWNSFTVPRSLVLAVFLVLLFELGLLALAAPPVGRGATLPAGAVGPVLFGPYALATEAATILLFLASLALIEPAERGA